ncbi:hydrogenase maturation protein HypF [Desulfonatronum thiosulfatophilum]|uniref:Carbamoyltransferase n=1 Tax=Desulfonatronum thiosulfatophilum TaxID=617002 RepID=A0A1G6BAQ2_9BACT|nr:carbamoyltransferase HypF [Desulfonatronum thiosulfatophilum]SDB17676.1 hydrogenase maturation protein HypF [Desulfonatronum thiosulfatophilum]
MHLQRYRLIVTGQVQGVGFRPTVYKLALESGLTGFVLNSAEGVAIEVQGSGSNASIFADLLRRSLPPLAQITSLSATPVPVQTGEKEFRILQSISATGHQVLISPDTATCDDCLGELFDPRNRRYRYPFINCTNCGPRLTITKSIPYDRPMTSMACFPQCPDCLREYEDPLNRRFHAQPNCCPICGPQVWLSSHQGSRLAEANSALEGAARALAEGKILAVKGLGGFHLVCAAGSDQAVAELRRRKQRWEKPLAVMASDVETALRVAVVSPAAQEQLVSIQRPIVLLPAAHNGILSEHLAPDTDYLGLMLPYTPLHHVLLDMFRLAVGPKWPPVLVMTSGNLSSEPIALGNREALQRLAPLADLFLFHDRDILIRCDDSVLRPNSVTGQPDFFRRARGYTPSPVFLRRPGPSVLGLGPELKVTVCLTKGDQAFVSQHVGDLKNLETFAFYRETISHLQSILQVRPEAQVADLHPDYMSTVHGRELEGPLFQLQHHVAHIHSVLAENRHELPALGLALDGAGLGDDRTIWGGEALLVDPRGTEYARLGHFAPVMQPGGEAAAREPWRMARSYLWSIGIATPADRPWPWLETHGQADAMVGTMLHKQINSPQTTSCGRLFDAVAGLLGLKNVMAYEGQAAIILERIQHPGDLEPYPCPLRLDLEPVQLDTLFLFSQVHADWERGAPAGMISRRFHLGLIRGLAELAVRLAERAGVHSVGLSGGVMQNATLATLLPAALAKRGLTALMHAQLPPNDACISLGQAMYGRMMLERG